jgi:hypothetical protein
LGNGYFVENKGNESLLVNSLQGTICEGILLTSWLAPNAAQLAADHPV